MACMELALILSLIIATVLISQKRKAPVPNQNPKRTRSKSPRERPDWSEGFQTVRHAARPNSPAQREASSGPSTSGVGNHTPANQIVQNGGTDNIYKNHVTLAVGRKNVKVRGHITSIFAHRLKLENLDKLKGDLQDTFIGIINKFIVDSLHSQNLDPEKTKFCLILRHPGFRESEGFFLSWRRHAETNGTAVWNLMTKFGQSNSALKIDDAFEMIIHAYTPAAAAYMTDNFGGACSTSKDFDRVKKLNNMLQHNDRKCLIRSLLIARQWTIVSKLDMRIEATTNLFLKTKYLVQRGTAYDQYRQWIRTDRNQSNRKLEKATIELMNDAGLLPDKLFYDETDIDKIAEQWIDYRIVLWTRRNTNKHYYKSGVWNPEAQETINIALFNKHYNPFKPTRNSLNAIVCRFCKDCYKQEHRHNCPEKCRKCHHPECKVDTGYKKFCDDCRVTFFDQECFHRHLLPRPDCKTSACNEYKVCANCDIFHRTREGHECFKIKYCSMCRVKVEDIASHNCCWPIPTPKNKEKLKKNQDEFTIVTYDVESIVTGDSGEVEDYAIEQRVNVVCWRRMCDKCAWDPVLQGNRAKQCKKCGIREGTFMFSDPGCNDKDPETSVIARFVNFLKTDPKNKDAYVIAHNGSGYDNHFVLAEFIRRHQIPSIVPNGRRIMKMTSPGDARNSNKLTFKDSFLLLPLPLAQLPGAFSLGVDVEKGEFPYLFNHSDHYGITYPAHPPRQFYCVDAKKPEAVQKFNVWYNENSHKPFDFNREIENYCKTDVDILERALIKYMSTSLAMTGWNPVIHCGTYAGYTMFLLKNMHLQPGQMAVLPENGYFNGQRQSAVAIKYIRWLQHKYQRPLQHQESPLGEKTFKLPGRSYAVRVDAFDEATKTVYEVLGCMFHGCQKCYSEDARHPYLNKTMGMVHDETMARISSLKAHTNEIDSVVPIWEHEIDALLASDADMKEFFDAQKVIGRLQPRDAFMGGRTQTFALTATPDPSKGEELRYWDFCSLYPWICALVAKYPIGQPEVICEDRSSEFLTGKASPYKGLIKCDVLCPRGLYYPTIGVKHEGRLIFANCHACMVEQNNDECNHSIEERQFHVTVTDVELTDALQQGYKVLKTYELWSWPEDKWETGGIFKEFVMKFYGEKQKASDWPNGVHTTEEKQEFLDQLKANIGVDIKSEDVVPNKSLRTVAKLLLNSSWGKTGERPDKTHVEFVECDSPQLGKILADETLDISGLNFVTDEIVMISYKNKKDFQGPVPYTNVAYAAITTATARIELLKVLRRLGRRVVYCDTDSVIFMADPLMNEEEQLNDLRQGEWLGQLTDEIPEGWRIADFVSIAPKVYGLRLKDQHGNEKFNLKVKGVTMDAEASKKITFETLLNMAEALKNQEPEITVKTSRMMIKKPRIGVVTTEPVARTLRAVMSKVRVFSDGTTAPFGYNEN